MTAPLASSAPRVRPVGVADRINRALRPVPPWPIYPLAVLPIVWLFWQGVQGRLGVDPTRVIEHRTGLWGLWLLIAVLAVTPLARFTGIRLVRYRRALGVTAFFYILVHLAVWLGLDVQIPAQILTDIAKRPYITIGMVAFLLMLPLALTSNDWSIRRLGGARWRRLHRLTYVVVPLGAIHFVMVLKGWQIEPLQYLGGVLVLLALRLLPRAHRGR